MGAVEGKFPQFGNYSRWSGIESVKFSPPAGMKEGPTIPIDIGIFGVPLSLSAGGEDMCPLHVFETVGSGKGNERTGTNLID